MTASITAPIMVYVWIQDQEDVFVIQCGRGHIVNTGNVLTIVLVMDSVTRPVSAILVIQVSKTCIIQSNLYMYIV